MSVRLDIRGQDTIGRFGCSTTKRCGVCESDGELTLRYTDLKQRDDSFMPVTLTMIRDNVQLKDTVLAKSYEDRDGWVGGGWIGVTCGCYAKFQRQVAHIDSYYRRTKRQHPARVEQRVGPGGQP
jgi:hypothetical protein